MEMLASGGLVMFDGHVPTMLPPHSAPKAENPEDGPF
jgi:hypothetical protein